MKFKLWRHMKKITNSPEPRERDAPHSFAGLALIGIVLYLAIDIALGVLRPDYSLVKNYESDYGRGPFSWLMDVNFILRGVLSVLAVIAMRRAGVASRSTAVLMWVWAGASALLAFFPDNPAGYPHVATGAIHLILAGIAFVTIAIATVMISFARGRLTGGLIPLRVIAVVGVIALVLVGHPFGVPGLVERVFLAAQLCWLVIVLAVVIRRSRIRVLETSGTDATGNRSPMRPDLTAS